MTQQLHPQLHHVRQALTALGRVLVAFSGGVDSTLLLKIAVDTLGAEPVLAAIVDSAVFPRRELADARYIAESLGAHVEVIRVEEIADERFYANPPERCYYCKREIFAQLVARAQAGGYAAVLDGSNADDAGDWRPGSTACHELGVRSPLQETGMTKAEVRELSRALGLPTADKPSYACLASRIPYGDPITPQALAVIETAENYLYDLGFTQVRVRHHGHLARLEMVPDELNRLFDPALRAQLTTHLRALGYQYVTLDLQGYRTGSMNEVL